MAKCDIPENEFEVIEEEIATNHVENAINSSIRSSCPTQRVNPFIRSSGQQSTSSGITRSRFTFANRHGNEQSTSSAINTSGISFANRYGNQPSTTSRFTRTRYGHMNRNRTEELQGASLFRHENSFSVTSGDQELQGASLFRHENSFSVTSGDQVRGAECLPPRETPLLKLVMDSNRIHGNPGPRTNPLRNMRHQWSSNSSGSARGNCGQLDVFTTELTNGIQQMNLGNARSKPLFPEFFGARTEQGAQGGNDNTHDFFGARTEQGAQGGNDNTHDFFGARAEQGAQGGNDNMHDFFGARTEQGAQGGNNNPKDGQNVDGAWGYDDPFAYIYKFGRGSQKDTKQTKVKSNFLDNIEPPKDKNKVSEDDCKPPKSENVGTTFGEEVMDTDSDSDEAFSRNFNYSQGPTEDGPNRENGNKPNTGPGPSNSEDSKNSRL